MKIASFCIPHIGGAYTVARNLREGLKEHGITMRWIGVGARGLQAMSEPRLKSEQQFGEVVAPTEVDMTQQAKALATHLDREDYEGAFIDVLGGTLQANIARYLPSSILRILIVHTITPATYAFASAIRDHVHAAVGVSLRIRQDLVCKHGFPPNRTMAIPNGVDLAQFEQLKRTQDPSILRVVYLGRIEDGAKGIFWLPKILSQVDYGSVRLTIAGEGPDLERLKKCFLGKESVEFTGAVNHYDVPSLLSCHDVLLMPSRYEGFGLTLIEAMAAGCVPLASRIRGVTDMIVNHGKTGLLFPIGDTLAAAKAIKTLSTDRELLNALSFQGRQTVREQFTHSISAAAYAALIERIHLVRPAIAEPLPLDQWELPRGLRAGWRSHLPIGLKNLLRQWLERFDR